MGWVLFSFHLQRFYSLVVSDERATLYLVRFPMCAASGGFSAWGNTWESRTLPDSTKKSLRRCLGLFLCASRQVLLQGRFQANVQHCTWLGSPMCAASGGFSAWGNTWERAYSPVVLNECATNESRLLYKKELH